MDKREQAIAELKKQIKEQRSRLDPKLLKIAEQAVSAAQSGKESMIPYDRESATATIELFLKDHKDPGGFKQRLLEFLRKQAH